jgi:tetratricopeptide (TPR) repeat protein
MNRGWKFLLGLLLLAASLRAAEAEALLRAALAAEARMDCPAALRLFHEADAARPNDAFILQKISRQYSDLVDDQAGVEDKKRYAQTALEYARRAATLKPADPVNVLSVAICRGKLALNSDLRTRVEYSRLVREDTERALALDPDYAWAHHVLGRWHCEVASLGAAARFFVRLFYGGLPAASYDEGIRQLRRATELEPDELVHWLELGHACAAAGRTDEARRHWAHGLAMPTRHKPDEPAKRRARAALAQSDQH